MKPTNRYVDRVLTSNSFEELHSRFKNYKRPSKEISESFAAMANLRKVCRVDDYTWLHIGDGPHFCTAAIFAFFSKSCNWSIDPKLDSASFYWWMGKFNVQNCFPYGFKYEEFSKECSHFIEKEKIGITCIHAHVKLNEVDKHFPKWSYLYSNVCCFKDQQTFSEEYMNQNNIQKLLEYDDYGILSEKRHIVIYQKEQYSNE